MASGGSRWFFGRGEGASMLLRGNLVENPWDNPAQLTDDQAEELIRDLIDGLNKYPETNAKFVLFENVSWLETKCVPVTR